MFYQRRRNMPWIGRPAGGFENLASQEFRKPPTGWTHGTVWPSQSSERLMLCNPFLSLPKIGGIQLGKASTQKQCVGGHTTGKGIETETVCGRECARLAGGHRRWRVKGAGARHTGTVGHACMWGAVQSVGACGGRCKAWVHVGGGAKRQSAQPKQECTAGKAAPGQRHARLLCMQRWLNKEGKENERGHLLDRFR
eukprot:366172-Chlamydomonas_euryale.AAC.9